MTLRILLVGCGKMGGALLNGWGKNTSYIISSLDPHYEDADYTGADEITTPFDVIVLAVKPQVMEEVCDSIRHLVQPKTLVLSIAAGKTTGFFEELFGATQPVIRCMPNTPALIGKGISVLCGNAAATSAHRETSINLMSAVGDAEWIDDENLMNAVTAVSGSGPAYVFHLIEAMTESGIAAGLCPALSTLLARQTVIGAAALAEQQPDISAETLRQNVTSKGGTTEAALEVLMENNALTALMTRAILAAKSRGEKLQ